VKKANRGSPATHSYADGPDEEAAGVV